MSQFVKVHKPLDERSSWFPKLRFGVFVHFGLYAILGRGEWVMQRENIPLADYQRLMKRFNPKKFDSDEWVKFARRAGAKYMAITAKHHDGFCLFDSKLTDYKITNTPFKRDLIGEIIDACHRADLRIVLYYSNPDWSHPAYGPRDGFKDGHPQKGDRADWAAYLAYFRGQVEELCTNYGRIDGLWFDGMNKSHVEWEGKQVYDLVKRLQPHAVVNDRAGWGDYYTPERRMATAATSLGYMVEACDCVAKGSWGYAPNLELRSTPSLVHDLVRLASAGANYLLNIGPKADGSLPRDWVKRFEEIGDWLGKSGRSIYDTQGCPGYEQSPTQYYTRTDKKLYVHLLEWPGSDRLKLDNISKSPVRVRVLGESGALNVEKTDGAFILKGLPASAPDPVANVIELTFNTTNFLRPRNLVAPPPVLQLNSQPLDVRVSDAPGIHLSLKGLPLPTYPVREQVPEDISNLWQPEHVLTWTIDNAAAGEFDVSLTSACAAGKHGSRYVITTGDQSIEGVIPRTKSWWTGHKTVPVGRLRLPKGRVKLSMHPTYLVRPGAFGIIRKLTLMRTDR